MPRLTAAERVNSGCCFANSYKFRLSYVDVVSPQGEFLKRKLDLNRIQRRTIILQIGLICGFDEI